jgi:hypothetical protein
VQAAGAGEVDELERAAPKQVSPYVSAGIVAVLHVNSQRRPYFSNGLHKRWKTPTELKECSGHTSRTGFGPLRFRRMILGLLGPRRHLLQ